MLFIYRLNVFLPSPATAFWAGLTWKTPLPCVSAIDSEIQSQRGLGWGGAQEQNPAILSTLIQDRPVGLRVTGMRIQIKSYIYLVLVVCRELVYDMGDISKLKCAPKGHWASWRNGTPLQSDDIGHGDGETMETDVTPGRQLALECLWCLGLRF